MKSQYCKWHPEVPTLKGKLCRGCINETRRLWKLGIKNIKTKEELERLVKENPPLQRGGHGVSGIKLLTDEQFASMTRQEIAAKCNITVSAVSVYISRHKKKVKLMRRPNNPTPVIKQRKEMQKANKAKKNDNSIRGGRRNTDDFSLTHKTSWGTVNADSLRITARPKGRY